MREPRTDQTAGPEPTAERLFAAGPRQPDPARSIPRPQKSVRASAPYLRRRRTAGHQQSGAGPASRSLGRAPGSQSIRFAAPARSRHARTAREKTREKSSRHETSSQRVSLQVGQALGQLHPNDFPGNIDLTTNSVHEGDQHFPTGSLLGVFLYREKSLAAVILNPANDSQRLLRRKGSHFATDQVGVGILPGLGTRSLAFGS